MIVVVWATMLEIKLVDACNAWNSANLDILDSMYTAYPRCGNSHVSPLSDAGIRNIDTKMASTCISATTAATAFVAAHATAAAAGTECDNARAQKNRMGDARAERHFA